MNEHNIIGLREMLEQLPTPKLDEMLQTELMKDVPDEEAVRVILRVLEDREKDEPKTFTPREEAAWKRYQERTALRKRKKLPDRRWLAMAASLVVVVFLVVTVIPQQAEAESFWEMLQRWSSTVLEIISGEGQKAGMPYTFETDNPGLQQVYEAVVELGVTEPVVPMWLPDGFELSEQNVIETPMLKGVYVCFSDGKKEIVYKLDLYDGEPAHQYYKDDTHSESYEKNGTIFNITKNLDEWVVVWTKDNIECSIFIDCQEDALRRVLESIYVMEE